MKAVIFNSGIGQRMGESTQFKHKSMVELKNGETIYERQIRILSECGINEFIITTGAFKEQLVNAAMKYDFKDLKFTFIENSIYNQTNYIYSMYLAKDHLNDDCLILHGDLVFNKRYIIKMLKSSQKDLGSVNKKIQLPQKDFKAQIKGDNILKISIEIFDNDCYAFQPLYKLSKITLKKWLDEVEKFIVEKNVTVYAEEALNKILNNLQIKSFSYEDDFVDEIDTLEDFQKVSEGIRKFDSDIKEISSK